MGSPVPFPLHKTVTEKLERGKEKTIQLQALIQKTCGDGESSALAKELMRQISGSFEEIITLVTSASEENGLSQIAAADGAKRVPPVDRSSKGPDRSKKRPGVKDRRGCYRRRNSAQTWVEVSPSTEDGYAWRKYGQKDILNNKFPRCYFRCTHKNDQGCKATKQVQRMKDDPPLHQTTYFGLHTCQKYSLARTPQIISEPDPMESCLLSFQTKTPPNVPRHKELKDETQSDVTDSKSCLDSSMWQDMMPSESSGTQKPEPSNANRGVFNDQEVVSGFHSCSSTPVHHHDPVDMEDFPADHFGDLQEDLYLDVIEFDHLRFSS